MLALAKPADRDEIINLKTFKFENFNNIRNYMKPVKHVLS